MIRKVLLISLLLCLVLTACTPEPERLPTIRLGCAPHDHHAALYLAAQLPDYFRQHGDIFLKEIIFQEHYQLIRQGQAVANILIHKSTGGGQLIRKLHENQLDVTLGAVPAMIKQIDAGSPMKIVAPMMAEGAALVMARDFPADDWAGFVVALQQRSSPLRIGYKIETSVQNLIFEQALLAEGISFSTDTADKNAQVVVRNLYGPNNLIPALEMGVIDGFVVMQPFAALAEYQSVGKVVAQLRDLPPQGRWVEHPCCALAANGELLSQQREVLIDLTTLLLRASRYLQQHPEDASRLVAVWLQSSTAVEDLSLPTIKFLVDYSANWDRGVEFWINSMGQRGMLSGRLKTVPDKGVIKKLLYDMDIYDRARMQVE